MPYNIGKPAKHLNVYDVTILCDGGVEAYFPAKGYDEDDAAEEAMRWALETHYRPVEVVSVELDQDGAWS